MDEVTNFPLGTLAIPPLSLAELTNLVQSATSLEMAANRLVTQLYDQLKDSSSSEPACALIRFFITHQFHKLPGQLQVVARQAANGTLPSLTKCLVLLATAGTEPEWNARTLSAGHQAIPLTSEEMVLQSPMIAQMIQQFGLKVNMVVSGDPGALLGMEHRTHNVFYVPQALDSPYIPAQDEFVKPYGIQSVVGIGGILPYGALFAMILFSKIPISEQAVQQCGSLARMIKMALVPLAAKPIFS